MSARTTAPPTWTEEKFYPHFLHKPLKIIPLSKTLTRVLRKFERLDLSSSGEYSSSSGDDYPSSRSGEVSEDDEELAESVQQITLKEISYTGLTVMVVEDNLMNQKVIGRVSPILQ